MSTLCEMYYKSQTLSDKQKTDLVQVCSRHRSSTPPPKDSPTKGFWDLDISPEKEKPFKYEILLTRKKRKELRELEEKELNEKKYKTSEETVRDGKKGFVERV